MILPEFLNSKFKIIEIIIILFSLILIVFFVSDRLVFLISVFNRIFSQAEVNVEKVEINAVGLEQLNR